MLSLNRRRGRFQIPLAIIENEPEIARRVMGEVIVIEAGISWGSVAVQYVAVSPHFRELKEDEATADYVATVSKDEDGQPHISFTER